MTSAISQRQALMVLNALPGLGPVRIGRILEAFGGEAAPALAASEARLREVRDIGRETASTISGWRQCFDLEREEALLERSEAAFVLRGEAGYPRALAQLPDAPFGLYIRGQVPRQPVVAIIGTRRPTLYGRQVAKKLAADLARAGFSVASGLARGIDSEAHEGALSTGTTIGVLGCGLDIVYPPENRELYERVAATGAIVSEFPFGRQPDQQTFPQRNRLVSGMADAVIVVESDIKGGSMITARFAAEQGRTGFAVPGRIDQPSARGCHALIRDGASLLTGADDVVSELRFMQLPLQAAPEAARQSAHEAAPDRAGAMDLSTDEAAVLAMLADGAVLHPEAITLGARLAHPAAMAALMLLELKRLVAKRADGAYERR